MTLTEASHHQHDHQATCYSVSGSHLDRYVCVNGYVVGYQKQQSVAVEHTSGEIHPGSFEGYDRGWRGIRGPVGYTFMVVNNGLKYGGGDRPPGYPSVVLSNDNGNTFKISYSHQPTVVYAEPTPKRVLLKPGGVASFGISYRQVITQPSNPTSSCAAQLIDLRLPTQASGFFTFEFPVKTDVCSAL